MTSPIFQFAARLQKQMGTEFAVLQEHEFNSAMVATNGYMFKKSVHSDWTLFKTPNLFNSLATDELKEHCLRYPRTTRQAFEQQWLDDLLGE